VQLKYHTCIVELYLGYFGARELGCNAEDVSLDGDMHLFEWGLVTHKHNGMVKNAGESPSLCEEGGFPLGKRFGKYWGGISQEIGQFMPCPPSYFSI